MAVTLVAEGDGFAVTLGDAVHRVASVTPTAVASIAGATVEALDVMLDGRSRRAVVARTRDRIHVALDGQAYTFEPVDDAHGGAAAGAGSGTVVAPMAGGMVDAGAVLVEIEARGDS
jgi:acetyl/propionyl-CoA carboxylase alpha subunit